MDERRIFFVTSYRFMSYEFYLKRKIPMCEIKSNQILSRNPSLINSINRDLPHPLLNLSHYIFDEGEERV